MTSLTWKITLPALIAAMSICAVARASEGGANKDEATAMVKKAVAFIKSDGVDKAYAEIVRLGRLIRRGKLKG